MPHVGDLLAGRYRIDAPLGAGGNAVVYRGHDLRLRRDVALKVLLPNLAQDPAVAHRFEREARSLAAVNHPGIVAVYDVEAGDPRTDREPFFVMELCDRGSLADLIASSGGHVAPDVLAPLIVDVAGGLSSLHARGFIHRDVKPHNILLTPGGAKLGDLGIARGDDTTDAFTAPGHAVGTLAYLAPEILTGAPGTRASDVFALGAVAYIALTGRLPRPASSVVEFVQAQEQAIAPPSEIRPELGTFFDALVLAALGDDPALRPTPIQFAGSLKAATADWRRAGRLPRAVPAADRQPELAGIALAPWSADDGAVTDVGHSGRLRDPAGPRPIRLAPAGTGLPMTGRTTSGGVRPARRPPPPHWLPRPQRRSFVGPLVAGAAILALAVLVAFALTDGFRAFGLNPGPAGSASPSGAASASPSVSPSASASASPSASPSPSPTPSVSPSPTPTLAPTPVPTAPPTPFATPTPRRTAPPIVNVGEAQQQLQNMRSAIESAERLGNIDSDHANELRIRVNGIGILLDNAAYQQAANAVDELAALISQFEVSGDLIGSGEIRNVLDKLQQALPPPN